MGGRERLEREIMGGGMRGKEMGRWEGEGGEAWHVEERLESKRDQAPRKETQIHIHTSVYTWTCTHKR